MMEVVFGQVMNAAECKVDEAEKSRRGCYNSRGGDNDLENRGITQSI